METATPVDLKEQLEDLSRGDLLKKAQAAFETMGTAQIRKELLRLLTKN